jgi:hypothetical protein
MASSRVFRQVITVEVIWISDPGTEEPKAGWDWPSVVRDGVLANDVYAHTYAVPGIVVGGEVEELAPGATA